VAFAAPEASDIADAEDLDEARDAALSACRACFSGEGCVWALNPEGARLTMGEDWTLGGRCVSSSAPSASSAAFYATSASCTTKWVNSAYDEDEDDQDDVLDWSGSEEEESQTATGIASPKLGQSFSMEDLGDALTPSSGSASELEEFDDEEAELRDKIGQHQAEEDASAARKAAALAKPVTAEEQADFDAWGTGLEDDGQDDMPEIASISSGPGYGEVSYANLGGFAAELVKQGILKADGAEGHLRELLKAAIGSSDDDLKAFVTEMSGPHMGGKEFAAKLAPHMGLIRPHLGAPTRRMPNMEAAFFSVGYLCITNFGEGW
jgi:hypothetical protein